MNLNIKKFLNLNKPWAIMKNDFLEISHLRAEALKMNRSEISAKIEEFKNYQPQNIKSQIFGNTAILPIHGIIMRYFDICTWFLGGVAIENLQNEFRELLNNPKIENIILDINSPGGDADGVPEFSEMIFNSRDKKNIVAYIGFVGASAAYWIASAASKIVINEASVLGSIGMIMEFYEEDEKPVQMISSISPKKNPDIQTEEGKTEIQSFVDELGEIFVKKIALQRNIDTDYVLNHFGQGGVKIGKNAISSKMADEIDLLDNLILNLQKKNKIQSQKNSNESGKSNMKFLIKNKSNKTKAELVIVDNEEVEVPEDAESAEVIDKEWIETNLPDVAEEFREEGRKEEQKRQGEMDNIETETEEEEEVVEEAKSDLKSTPAEAKRKIKIQREKAKKEALADINKDAETIEGVQSSGGQDESAENPILNAVKKGIKKTPVKGINQK